MTMRKKSGDDGSCRRGYHRRSFATTIFLCPCSLITARYLTRARGHNLRIFITFRVVTE